MACRCCCGQEKKVAAWGGNDQVSEAARQKNTLVTKQVLRASIVWGEVSAAGAQIAVCGKSKTRWRLDCCLRRCTACKSSQVCICQPCCYILGISSRTLIYGYARCFGLWCSQGRRWARGANDNTGRVCVCSEWWHPMRYRIDAIRRFRMLFWFCNHDWFSNAEAEVGDVGYGCR